MNYEPTHLSIHDGSDIMVVLGRAYNESGERICDYNPIEWLAIGCSLPCRMCNGGIFIAGNDEGEVIWSHEGEGCDDPCPV